jgi:hypothetical protein
VTYGRTLGAAAALFPLLLGACRATEGGDPPSPREDEHDATHFDGPPPDALASGDATDADRPRRPSEPLIEWDDWTALTGNADPWAGLRQDVACDSPLPRVEEGMVEFNTAACGSYAVSAPLLVPIEVGDTIEMLMWHSTLFAPGREASGTFEVRINGHEVFSYERTYPQPQQFVDHTVEATFGAAAGDPVQVHVRNHGANTWHLAKIERRAAPR